MTALCSLKLDTGLWQRLLFRRDIGGAGAEEKKRGYQWYQHEAEAVLDPMRGAMQTQKPSSVWTVISLACYAR